MTERQGPAAVFEVDRDEFDELATRPRCVVCWEPWPCQDIGQTTNSPWNMHHELDVDALFQDDALDARSEASTATASTRTAS